MPPDPKHEYREHTAERWLRDDPEGYHACVEMIKRGEVNRSELARQFDRSRNSISALIYAEFSVEQLQEVIAKKGLIVTAEALDRQEDVIPNATAKELGALAMTSKAGMEVSKLARGQGSTQLHLHRHVHVNAQEAGERLLQEAQEMGLSMGENFALGAPGRVAGREVVNVVAMDVQSNAGLSLVADDESLMAGGDTDGDTLKSGTPLPRVGGEAGGGGGAGSAGSAPI